MIIADLTLLNAVPYLFSKTHERAYTVFFLRKIFPKKINKRFFLGKRREAPRFFLGFFTFFFGEIGAKRRFLQKKSNLGENVFFWEKIRVFLSFLEKKRFFLGFFLGKFKFRKKRFFLGKSPKP